jgi:hypothetical protein
MMMMSVALKGSVIPLGRRWPVFEKARMRKVVFLEVRVEMSLEGREMGRRRVVSKPVLGARESSVQGVLALLLFVVMVVFEGSLGCCSCCCCCWRM